MDAESHTIRYPQPRKQDIHVILYVVIGVFALLIGGTGGFLGGMQYQKGQSTVATTGGTGNGGTSLQGRGNFGGLARRGGFGTVSAVTATSITISMQSRGSSTPTSKTYSINSSTTVTDNGSTSTVSAIAVGDIVRIQTSSSDNTTATAITLQGSPAANPTSGGSTTPSTSD